MNGIEVKNRKERPILKDAARTARDQQNTDENAQNPRKNAGHANHCEGLPQAGQQFAAQLLEVGRKKIDPVKH